jgi:hypothetical protein
MRSNLEDQTEADYYYSYGMMDRWKHDQGRVCFDQIAEGLGVEKIVPNLVY